MFKSLAAKNLYLLVDTNLLNRTSFIRLTLKENISQVSLLTIFRKETSKNTSQRKLVINQEKKISVC